MEDGTASVPVNFYILVACQLCTASVNGCSSRTAQHLVVVSVGCGPVDAVVLFFLLLLLWEEGAGKQDEHLTCPVGFPMSFGGQRALQPWLGCGQQAGSIKAEQCMDALA